MTADGARPAGRRGRGQSAMGNLFGRKKQSRVTEQDRAVLVSEGRGREQAGRRAGAAARAGSGARGPGRGRCSGPGPGVGTLPSAAWPAGLVDSFLGSRRTPTLVSGDAWAAPRGRVVRLCPSTKTRLRDTFRNSDLAGTSWARAALSPFASPTL